MGEGRGPLWGGWSSRDSGKSWKRRSAWCEERSSQHCSLRGVCSCLGASLGLPLGRGRKVGVSFALGWDISGEECSAWRAPGRLTLCKQAPPRGLFLVPQQDPASQVLADVPEPQNQAVQAPYTPTGRLGRGPILTFTPASSLPGRQWVRFSCCVFGAQMPPLLPEGPGHLF